MSINEEIEDIKRELQSDKKQIRQKAFVKLSSLCTSQRNVVDGIFGNNGGDADFSYNFLFYCAHEGNFTLVYAQFK